MSFETILLIAGILMLLLGLIGHIKVKEFELGTNNTVIRFIIAILGLGLLALSFNPNILRTDENKLAVTKSKFNTTEADTEAAINARAKADAAQAKADADAAAAQAKADAEKAKADADAAAAQAKADAEKAKADADAAAAAQAKADAAQAKADADAAAAAQAKADAEKAQAKADADAQAAAKAKAEADKIKLYPRTGLPCNRNMEAWCKKYGATSCMTIEAVDNTISDICRWDNITDSLECGRTAGLWATPESRFAQRHPGTVRPGENGSCTTQAKNLSNKKYFQDNNKIMQK